MCSTITHVEMLLHVPCIVRFTFNICIWYRYSNSMFRAQHEPIKGGNNNWILWSGKDWFCYINLIKDWLHYINLNRVICFSSKESTSLNHKVPLIFLPIVICALSISGGQISSGSTEPVT